FKFLIKNYDCIWFTDPRPYMRVEKNIPPGKKIIYDCMDDVSEFSSLKESVKLDEVLMAENRLCARAYLIIVSSQNLYNVISKKYHAESRKMYLMNNGLDMNF